METGGRRRRQSYAALGRSISNRFAGDKGVSRHNRFAGSEGIADCQSITRRHTVVNPCLLQNYKDRQFVPVLVNSITPALRTWTNWPTCRAIQLTNA